MLSQCEDVRNDVLLLEEVQTPVRRANVSLQGKRQSVSDSRDDFNDKETLETRPNLQIAQNEVDGDKVMIKCC